MTLNLMLKCEIIKRFGTQVNASRVTGIRESRLSYIVRGHVEPNREERQALEAALGKEATMNALGPSHEESEATTRGCEK